MQQIQIETSKLFYPALEAAYGEVNRKIGAWVVIEESVEHKPANVVLVTITVIDSMAAYYLGKQHGLNLSKL